MPISNNPFTKYRPARQKLTQMETLYTQQLLTYDYEPTVNVAEIDFITRATDRDVENPLLTRRVGAVIEAGPSADSETLNIGGFEITYSFPHTRRPNIFTNRRTGNRRTYGSGQFSYRHLYEFLCHVFNSGVYFLDEYFDGEFQLTSTYQRLETFRKKILDTMVEELFAERKKQGAKQRVRNRYNKGSVEAEYLRTFKSWRGFDVWKNDIIKEELDQIGAQIREQIIVSLANGMIPLWKRSNAPDTELLKADLGFERPEAVFFASGSLIEHLSVYIALDKEAA